MTIIAIAVSESVGELTQQFPIYNAIVEYVRAFVDEDLGWVIGVAYWYVRLTLEILAVGEVGTDGKEIGTRTRLLSPLKISPRQASRNTGVCQRSGRFWRSMSSPHSCTWDST